MSDAPDSRDRVIEDLVTWIRQNGGDENGWYIEEAPPEGPAGHSAAEPAANEEIEEKRPAGGAEHAAPVPRPPAPPAPAVKAAGDEAFDRMCARFVADTMATIVKHGAVLGDERLPGDPVADKAAALEALRAEVLPCTKCALSERRTNTVFGAGDPDADVVFVGEAPGEEEDKQGEPFVGRSGQLLTKILEAIGYARDEVFICNILKCRPPNNRDPQPAEVAACEPHLKAQLAILRPRVICCLGRVAAQTLLGTTASLGKLRAAVHFYAGIPVMATYHPAALLRNPNYKRDTWDDVRKLRALVDALKAAEG
jgi:DNA polymerase